MKKKASHKKHERQKLATIAMVVGITLLLISTAISAIYIQPSNFKRDFKKRQLEDCLQTTTNPVTCSQKFNS